MLALWFASSAAAQQVSCDTTPRADAHLYRAESRSELAGTFRLVLISASKQRSTDKSPPVEATLTLSLVDSAERAIAATRRLGYRQRVDLQLVGTSRWMAANVTEPAEVDAATLLIGCRDCTDASPAVMGIRGVTPRGFFGTWHDYQTGIGRVIGSDGKPGADPQGYYCATRFAAPE
jgi:hypothetical protein